MKDTIIFAGTSRPQNVDDVEKVFPRDTFTYICLYHREPTDDQRANYFSKFDLTVRHNELTADLLERTLLITCTQERDMSTYLFVLKNSKFITQEQYELWQQLINKKELKEVLQAEYPELVPKTSSLAETDCSTVSYPVVVKPIDSTGSQFVKVINNKSELDSYLKDLAAHQPKRVELSKLIVEEFIAGPQYSINTYIDSSGTITYCPVVRVIPAFELGQNDSFSAIQYNTELPASIFKGLQDVVEKIVHRFKVTSTSAHFDCVHSPHGWKILEVGIRIGGLRQDMFLRSHGFNHMQNDVRNRTGLPLDLQERKKTVAIIQKTPLVAGYLEAVDFTPPANSNLTHYIDKWKERGSEIGPVSQGGVIAFRVFVEGESEDDVLEEARTIFTDTSFEMHLD